MRMNTCPVYTGSTLALVSFLFLLLDPTTSSSSSASSSAHPYLVHWEGWSRNHQPQLQTRGGSAAVSKSSNNKESEKDDTKGPEKLFFPFFPAEKKPSQSQPQQQQPSTTKSTLKKTSSDSSKGTDKSKNKSKDPPKRRGWFGGSNADEKKKQNKNDEKKKHKEDLDKTQKEEKQKQKLEKQKQKKGEPQQEPQKTSDGATNTTTTSSDSNQGVYVQGAMPPAYRVVRASPNSVPGGMIVRPGASHSSQSILVTDLVTSLVRLGTRVWIFYWMRRYLLEHEQIRPVQRFVWERLNDRYSRDAAVLDHVMSNPPLGVWRWWWRLIQNWNVFRGTQLSLRRPLHEMFNRTVVVLPLAADSGSGGLNLQFLRDAVTFLLEQYRAKAFGVSRRDGKLLPLEVVLLVTSPGGSVTHYGLAAAQVQRLAQEEGLKLTVCVDKVAASGGYMIASQAHHVIAAPFAALGSVGVIMEGINFRELAREFGIQPVVLKSGKYKNPISTFGAISKSDEEHERQRLVKVHEAFQDLVVASRPALADQRDVLEGQVYLGEEALELNLVDDVKTSDEYIMECVAAGDRVLKCHQLHTKKASIRINPMDLLPHLRKYATPQNITPLLLTIGPVWNFVNHALQQLMSSAFSSPDDF